DMLAAVLAAFLSPVENGGQHDFQPGGIEELALDVVDHNAVQFLHRDRTAFASRLALPRLDRASVVAITPALAGADGHGPAALGAMADAGEQRRAAHHASGHDLGIARLEPGLNRVEGFPVDQRRHLDHHDFAFRFQLLGLAALVKLMFANVGAPGQDAVNLADTPASAVTREDAPRIEVTDDGLDAHRTGTVVAVQRKAEDEPDRVSVQRVDFQLLLDLRAARLGGDDAIADRGQRAVPKTLLRILLLRAQDVLGVLLGLIFIEQRHNLPHHDVHGIVAHFLRDGDKLDAVLGELAHVELKLEVIAEEAREGMDDHHVERRGLTGPGLDHALELWSAVVGGRGSGLRIGFDKLIAARGAIGFALLALIGNGDIMLGLPRRRDAQIESGAQRHGHGSSLLVRS